MRLFSLLFWASWATSVDWWASRLQRQTRREPALKRRTYRTSEFLVLYEEDVLKVVSQPPAFPVFILLSAWPVVCPQCATAEESFADFIQNLPFDWKSDLQAGTPQAVFALSDLIDEDDNFSEVVEALKLERAPMLLAVADGQFYWGPLEPHRLPEFFQKVTRLSSRREWTSEQKRLFVAAACAAGCCLLPGSVWLARRSNGFMFVCSLIIFWLCSSGITFNIQNGWVLFGYDPATALRIVFSPSPKNQFVLEGLLCSGLHVALGALLTALVFAYRLSIHSPSARVDLGLLVLLTLSVAVFLLLMTINTLKAGMLMDRFWPPADLVAGHYRRDRMYADL